MNAIWEPIIAILLQHVKILKEVLVANARKDILEMDFRVLMKV